MKKTLFFLHLLISSNLYGTGNCIIYGKTGANTEINYYAPIASFGNMSIVSKAKSGLSGFFMIAIEVDKPTTAKFIFGQKTVWLLLQQKDSIQIDIKDTGDNNSVDWLEVRGKNRAGIEYYNKIYNFIPSMKFNNIRNIFERNHMKNTNEMINLIEIQLSNQTKWIDSLRSKNLVSDVYHDLVKYETQALIAAEVSVLCRKWFSQDLLNVAYKRDFIMQALINLVNPNDSKFWNATFASSYYNEYLKYKKIHDKEKIDTSKVIINEISYMDLAPDSVKWYVWGRDLIVYYTYASDSYDFCQLTDRYVLLYGENVFSEYLKSKNICNKKIKSNIIYIDSKQSNFFNLFAAIPHYRYYVDIWATWCTPCRKEFENYNENFFKFLNDNKIKPLFISIDDSIDEPKWKRLVETINLSGYHLLANKKLQESMREIIFDNGIVAIPRYLFVSEKGKILLDSAKRPSDGTLKAQLLEALKKNSK